MLKSSLEQRSLTQHRSCFDMSPQTRLENVPTSWEKSPVFSRWKCWTVLSKNGLLLYKDPGFFFLAGSVGTKHGWKLSVSSQEDSVVSCFEMLKHLVEQWSLAQRRSCFCSLYSVATKCDWKMSHCCKNGRVVSHVLNNGLSLCSCQKSKIPEDEERF